MPLTYLDRPPRIQMNLPQGEVSIPNPPASENSQQSLLTLLVPLVTIIAYVLLSASGQGSNLAFILPMALSVVVSAIAGVWLFVRTNRLQVRKQADYRRLLGEMRKDMITAQQQQRAYYLYTYPDPAVALNIDGSAKESRFGSRLWERRTSDPDFGEIRLGIGTRRSTVPYTLAGSEGGQANQVEEAVALSRNSEFVTDVPITVQLRQTAPPEKKKSDPKKEGKPDAASEGGMEKAPAVIARHSLGVISAKPDAAYRFVNGLLVQFTAFHSPADTRLYIVGADAVRPAWAWAYNLPHATSSSGSLLCFEDAPGTPQKDEGDLARFWRTLRTELERRQIRLDEDENDNVALPFLLVVVDMQALPEQSTLADIDGQPAIATILANGLRLGAAVIFMVPRAERVPSDCQAVIELDARAMRFRYAEIGLNSRRYLGEADTIAADERLDQFARQQARWALRTNLSGTLASAVSLLQVYGKARAEDFDLRAVWKRSRQPETADWLRVPVGLKSGNETRELIFSAQADGVHGMIAGTTGSGKSELLLMIIVGLALNYDPSVVNFVLVDFKGGAAFEGFRKLPHCVDIVTNLKGTAGSRTFTALRSEVKRREKLITDTNSKDIVHYRRRTDLPPDREPFPHLFIIIDEFAEMVKEMPELRPELDSITRVGRAIGISLILAAQSPGNVVTEQMRANMKFRICLRLEKPEESREMLHRSDAAHLPIGIPGRGYIQVGNENIELVQIARAGGPYVPTERKLEDADIEWLDDEAPDGAKKTEPRALSDILVERMAACADAYPDEIARQTKPWPDMLPTYLSLNALPTHGSDLPAIYPPNLLPSDVAWLRDADALSHGQLSETAVSDVSAHEEVSADEAALDGATLTLSPALERWLAGQGAWYGVRWQDRALRVPVGLIDHPEIARQLVLLVNLTRGHIVLFGASGWGKTMFLRTLIIGLAATHSPGELHVYALDFGASGLGVFRDLPQMGAIISATQTERVERLLRRLTLIIDERKLLLEQQRADDVIQYNAAHPQSIVPTILLVIDNFAEFRENFDAQIGTLISIARDGRVCGVYVVVTAEQTNALPAKLYSQFTERMTLKLAESGEYAGVVGRNMPAINDIPGRGYVAIDRRPLEFQIALPVGVSEDEERQAVESRKLYEVVDMMRETWAAQDRKHAWEGANPEPINVLPKLISLRDILPARTPTTPVQAILGMDDLHLGLALFDLKRQVPHFVVIGPPNSGKTTTLRTFALSLAARYSPEQVGLVLMDRQQRFFDYRGRHSLADLPHVLATACEPEDTAQLIESLRAQYEGSADQPTPREIFVLIDNYDDFGDLVPRDRDEHYKILGDLARRHAPKGLHFVISGSVSAVRPLEEFIKRIWESRFGLALQTAEAVEALNARPPYGLKDTELPVGRGFWVRSGKAHLMQVARPYETEQTEAALDAWVDEICTRYPNRAAWHGADAEMSAVPQITISTNGSANANGSINSNGHMPQNGHVQQYSVKQMDCIRQVMRNDYGLQSFAERADDEGIIDFVTSSGMDMTGCMEVSE